MCDIMENTKFIQKKLTTVLSDLVRDSMDSLNTDEVGKVTDMIKDMAMARYYTYKGLYYKQFSDPEYDNFRFGFMPYLTDPSKEDGVVKYDMGLLNHLKFGYTENMDKHDVARENYKTSKKRYEKTHSSSDRDDMVKYIIEYVDLCFDDLRKMYADVDQDGKKKIRSDFSSFLDKVLV